jgi:SAM-dependent methyltransferase
MTPEYLHLRHKLPKPQLENGVLKTREQLYGVLLQVRELDLPLCEDLAKNWDSLAALDSILRRVPKSGDILDAGAEMYSVILPWLASYGYKNLIGINLSFNSVTRRGAIAYEHGDITCTRFQDGFFDAITCLSVIEHGVNLQAYFAEAFRILKPGGILITSTDYYQTAIDTRGQIAFGVPIHIFNEKEIIRALETARKAGFELTGQIDLSTEEKVVTWDEYGLSYTFIIITHRKAA